MFSVAPDQSKQLLESTPHWKKLRSAQLTTNHSYKSADFRDDRTELKLKVDVESVNTPETLQYYDEIS